MRVLLAAGLDVHHVHKDGYAPLHRACWGREARHAAVVKLLVEEAGADPTLKGGGGAKEVGAAGAGKTCLEMTTNPHISAYLTSRLQQPPPPATAIMATVAGEL